MGWRDAPGDPAGPAARRGWRLHGLVVAASVGATWIVFSASLRNGFVSWDDLQMFPGNPGYRGLGWPQLRWMWTTFHYHEYMPLTWMTYGADYVLWGLDPFGYHLSNLVLHAVAVVAVYALSVRLLALGRVARESRHPVALAVGAGVAALLFAIHPLRVEPVVWASARGTILGGLLLVLTVLAYLNAVDRPSRSRARRRWLLASLGLYALALLARSTGVVLPAVLVTLDVYPLGRLGGRPGGWLGPEARAVWREKLPFLTLALAATPLALLARRLDSGASLVQSLTRLPEGLAVTGYGLIFYLRKTLVPSALSPLYERPLDVSAWAGPFLVSGVAVLGVTGLLIGLRRRWPAALAAWACYGVILLPTSGLVSFGLQLVADRYSYVACLGWALLAGAGAARGWQAWEAGRIDRRVWVASLALVAAGFAGLGELARQQVEVWRDSKTLWTHTVAVEPRAAAARAALGAVLEGEGRLDRALGHYREAARLWPHDGERRADLGRLLLKTGQPDEAVTHLHEALRLQAGSADAHIMLGIALARVGRTKEALGHHGEAVRMRPSAATTQYHLGLLSVELGRFEEAVGHYGAALAIQPGFVEAREAMERAHARLQASRQPPGG